MDRIQFRPGLLNFDTIETWGRRILCRGELSCHCRMSNSTCLTQQMPETPLPQLCHQKCSQKSLNVPRTKFPQLPTIGLENCKQITSDSFNPELLGGSLLIGHALLSLGFRPLRPRSGCWPRPPRSPFLLGLGPLQAHLESRPGARSLERPQPWLWPESGCRMVTDTAAVRARGLARPDGGGNRDPVRKCLGWGRTSLS